MYVCMYIHMFFIMCSELQVAQGHTRVTVIATDCRFDTHYSMKYLIFLFLRSVVEAKRGVEFRHSTRNASMISRKVGNDNVLMGTECLNTTFPFRLTLTKIIKPHQNTTQHRKDVLMKQKYFFSLYSESPYRAASRQPECLGKHRGGVWQLTLLWHFGRCGFMGITPGMAAIKDRGRTTNCEFVLKQVIRQKSLNLIQGISLNQNMFRFMFFFQLLFSNWQSAESGKQCVLTLGSLCLPCCMRDTA